MCKVVVCQSQERSQSMPDNNKYFFSDSSMPGIILCFMRSFSLQSPQQIWVGGVIPSLWLRKLAAQLRRLDSLQCLCTRPPYIPGSTRGLGPAKQTHTRETWRSKVLPAGRLLPADRNPRMAGADRAGVSSPTHQVS